MNGTRILVIGLMMGLITLAGVRAGAQSAKTDAVVCDFESGIPKDWKLTSSVGPKQEYAPTVELEKNGSNTVLELGKDALMTLGDQQFLNFTIEATVRREFDGSRADVGFQFHNGYRIYLRRPGRVELSGPNRSRMSGFTRNRKTQIPVVFKIVVAGPIVRCFVDGKFDGQFDGIEMTPGPIALYQGDVTHNVYFDNVKLDPRVDPAQFVAWEPVTGEEQALVFDPSKDVNLKFTAHNYAEIAQEVKLDIEIATFDDRPVCNKTFPAEKLAAGGTRTVELNLGKVPEGFYRMTFKPTGEVFPLAVHVRGTLTHDQITMPKIMTGVYWYHMNWELPPVWNYTYLHAACNDLRKHYFNTIICSVGTPTDFIETAGQYGIRCFTRGEGYKGNVTHPNVVGGFISDEPHAGEEAELLKLYTKMVTNYPDRVWTTCMIGDGGVKGCQSWWDSWMAIGESNKVVRMLRWYGIKKFTIGIGRTGDQISPFTETVRDLSRGKGPYYIVLPSFGENNELEAYYSNPTPAQMRGMLHLAAAFQAKGIFFWTYQPYQFKTTALVDTETLLPADGKWEAAGQAAAQIQKNADLLAGCTWSGRYTFMDGPTSLEAFKLNRKDDPAQYFYVVNEDERQAASGRLFNLDKTGSMRDLFADKDVPIIEGEVVSLRPDLKRICGTAAVSLQPGDGVLLKYVVAEAAADAALPRVVYPAAVANAPADKIIWLAEVKPLEMPTTGWIPAAKFKGKQWYPDYCSNDLNLYSGEKDAGQLYKKSLWAHAETTIKYAIPEGAVTLAAAAGFGCKSKESSAIFRVLVDGKEKYNSGVMKLGTPVQPVVVDITGGKLLELVTEEAGDGLDDDYTFWGEARLIKK